MNNFTIENPEDLKFSPIAKFKQSQHQHLEEVEGKHDAEPSIAATAIAIGLSGIEAGVAFYLLYPAGLLVASIGALFPVFLLWGMANHEAHNIQFAKKMNQLLNQYQDTQNATVTPIPSASNFSIPLIPDPSEFQENIIDELIAWVSNDNPNSPHKTPDMVKNWAEKRFFEQRKEELKREQEGIVHQRLSQYQIESTNLEKTTYIASDNQISHLGPKHQRQSRKEEYVKGELSKLQQIYKQDLQLIASRFNTLMQQCDGRINQAQANYEQAYSFWLKGKDQCEIEA